MGKQVETTYYLTRFSMDSLSRLKILLGKFLESNAWFDWRTSEGYLIQPRALNELNREWLARRFLETRFKIKPCDSLMLEAQLTQLGFEWETPYTYEELVLEIAKHLDLKIPIHYWGRLKQSQYASRAQARLTYGGIDAISNLNFTYRINYILDKRFVQAQDQMMAQYIGPKQVNSVESALAIQGYMLKKRHLTRQEALMLTRAANDNQLTDQLIQTYLTSNDSYYSQAVRSYHRTNVPEESLVQDDTY